MTEDDDFHVLLVEDNPGDARLIREMLRGIDGLDGRLDSPVTTADLRDVVVGQEAGTTRETRAVGRETTSGPPVVDHVDRLDTGLDSLDSNDVTVVLLDLNLPDSKGLDTLETVLERGASAPVIVLTGLADREIGIEALDRGAEGYLVKDEVNADQLIRSIYHAIQQQRYERSLERQRDRLTALNDLTQELLGAKTPQEIAVCIVEAAPTRLELPMTVVALYDEEAGRLTPAARTPQAATFIEDTSLLDADDGAAWQAFVDNETVLADVPGTDSSGLAVAGLVAPLGKHGVFITGLPFPGNRRGQQDFIDLVAANVRAALDRAAREQVLRERDRTLREQNVRLERLNRINDVIRDIDQALVAAASRPDIERAVCTELTTAGPYVFAWVGEYDVVTGTVEPRESAGAENDYLDALSSVGTVGSTEGGPTQRAVATREPQVVDDLLGDPPLSAWRREALKREYRACVVLPLAYNDVLYGLLTVFTAEPGAFDQLELDVLTELGDAIAYAINAVESKKALVSDEFVEVEFVVRDQAVSFLAVTTEIDCEVELESVIARSDGGYRVFFTAKGESPEPVVEFMNRELPIRETRVVAEHEDGCLFECAVHESGFFGRLLDQGAVPRQFTADDGEGRVVVELPEKSDIRRFLSMVETTYQDSELLARREQKRGYQTPRDVLAYLDGELTDRQREVLHTAYESGYFESPRASTGSEIASSLGVSQPTFTKHLRAGQRKLFQLVFDQDQGPTR